MKSSKTKNQKTVHDANNSLAAIMMSAEFLMQGIMGELNAKQKKYAKGILSEAKKLQGLLKKIEG